PISTRTVRRSTFTFVIRHSSFECLLMPERFLSAAHTRNRGWLAMRPQINSIGPELPSYAACAHRCLTPAWSGLAAAGAGSAGGRGSLVLGRAGAIAPGGAVRGEIGARPAACRRRERARLLRSLPGLSPA